MSKLYIDTDAAARFPGFIDELTAAGAVVVIYDDYVLDDELRAKVNAALAALDGDELAELPD